jgi:hypothetical protein
MACDCKLNKCGSVFNDAPVPVLSVGRSVYQLTVFKRAEPVPLFVLTEVSFSFKPFRKFLIQNSSEAQKLRHIDWVTAYLTMLFLLQTSSRCNRMRKGFKCGGSAVYFRNRCLTSFLTFMPFQHGGLQVQSVLKLHTDLERSAGDCWEYKNNYGICSTNSDEKIILVQL